MNVMVFEGFLGSGKTFGMSLFAKYYQEKSFVHCTVITVLIGSKPFVNLDTFHDIAKEESSILNLDEGHIDLDARSFRVTRKVLFSIVLLP